MSYTEEDRSRFSGAIWNKGARLLQSGGVSRDPDVPDVFWVRGSADQTYRVQRSAAGAKLTWMTCTCMHGMNAGGGQVACYHAAAVLLFDS